MPCYDCTHYLREWYNKHPLLHKEGWEKQPLFIRRGLQKKTWGKRLTPDTGIRILNRLAKQAELNKPIWNHLVRISRASHLAIVKRMPKTMHAKRGGWTPSSKILDEVYIVVGDEDVDDEMQRIAGNKPRQKDDDKSLLAPKVCPRCKQVNAPTMEVCEKCNSPLTLEGYMEMYEQVEKLNDLDKLVASMVEAKVKEMMKK